jgi:hypothetical protein
MQNKLIIISSVLLFILVSAAEGQKLVNSPYSRFNIGSIDPVGSFRSLSMGGTGIGMRYNNAIYFDNPASYSSFDTTSFLFDFGMDYSVNVLSNGTTSYSSDDMNFHHLLMGFPISRGWGFATGIVPVSNGYYDISQKIEEGDPGYNPITGSVASLHQGTGGFTEFFFGTGINITKNLSAGANMTILFGEIDRSNQYSFPDYTNSFSQVSVEYLRMNGVNFDYGLQYSAKLKKDYFITAGLSYTSPKNYSSSIEQLNERYAPFIYPSYSPDTLSYINSTSKDSTKLPGTIRFGLSFGKKDKFVAGIDYTLTNWTNARIFGSEAPMANTKSLLMGIEYIPDKYSNNSYLKRIEYRVGAHFSNNYLVLNGVQLKEYGLSCGLGLGMRNSLSRTNIYFDFTRKNGDLAKGLHNENIYSIGLSLNLYDFWFIKRNIYY